MRRVRRDVEIVVPACLALSVRVVTGRATRQPGVGPTRTVLGAGGALMRRIADAGVNVDFIHLSVSGQLVVGAGDIDAARAAAMET